MVGKIKSCFLNIFIFKQRLFCLNFYFLFIMPNIFTKIKQQLITLKEELMLFKKNKGLWLVPLILGFILIKTLSLIQKLGPSDQDHFLESDFNASPSFSDNLSDDDTSDESDGFDPSESSDDDTSDESNGFDPSDSGSESEKLGEQSVGAVPYSQGLHSHSLNDITTPDCDKLIKKKEGGGEIQTSSLTSSSPLFRDSESISDIPEFVKSNSSSNQQQTPPAETPQAETPPAALNVSVQPTESQLDSDISEFVQSNSSSNQQQTPPAETPSAETPPAALDAQIQPSESQSNSPLFSESDSIPDIPEFVQSNSSSNQHTSLNNLHVITCKACISMFYLNTV